MMATERQLLCCSTITLAILKARLVVGPPEQGQNLRRGQKQRRARLSGQQQLRLGQCNQR
jgi:hypothetical protein